MRPGPGLVVMALAFISGARRGSTSSISSKTITTSTTTSSPPPQNLATKTPLTSSLTLFQTTLPTSSSSLSPTPSTGTGDTFTARSSATKQSKKINENFGFFDSKLVTKQQLDDPQLQLSKRPKELEPLKLFNTFFTHNSYNSYASTLNNFAYSYPLPSHLAQQYDDPRARAESSGVLYSAKHTRRANPKFRRRKKRRTRSANVAFKGTASGSDDASDDTLTSLTTAVDSSSDQTTLARGLPVYFPSLTASRSLYEDDIFALVAEDDLLSEESFDHLVKLTNDKIGDTNEEDYSSGTEIVVDSLSSSGSGAPENVPHTPDQQNAIEDFVPKYQQQEPEQENQELHEQTENPELSEDDDIGSVDDRGQDKPNEDHEDSEQDILDTAYNANLVGNSNADVVLLSEADLTQAIHTGTTEKERRQVTTASSSTSKHLKTELEITNKYHTILESNFALTRLNPWISACDLAQPGPISAPDLQGECSAGALPVAWVDEGPGPPTCLKSCKEETPFTNKLNKDNMSNYLNNNNSNYNSKKNKNKNDNKLNKLVGYTTTTNTFNIKLRNSQPTISDSMNTNDNSNSNKNKNNKNIDNNDNNKNNNNNYNIIQKLLNPFKYYEINNNNNNNNKMAKTRRNSKATSSATLDHNVVGTKLITMTNDKQRNELSDSQSQAMSLYSSKDYDLLHDDMVMQKDKAATYKENEHDDHQFNDAVRAAAAVAMQLDQQQQQNHNNNDVVKIKLTAATYNDNNSQHNNQNNQFELKYNQMKPNQLSGSYSNKNNNNNNNNRRYQSNNINNSQKRSDTSPTSTTTTSNIVAANNQNSDQYLKISPPAKEQQQCLEYLGDSDKTMPTHLCHLLTPSDRLAQLRHLRLHNCCERNVYSALHTLALNATLSGGAGCIRVLNDLMDLDALASRITCGLTEILFRFDCRQVYSIIHQCDDCKEAYRRWVCSTLVPYFAETSDVMKPPEILTSTVKSTILDTVSSRDNVHSPTQSYNYHDNSLKNNTTMASNMTTSHTITSLPNTNSNNNNNNNRSDITSLKPLKTVTSNFFTNSNNNKNDMQYDAKNFYMQQTQQEQHRVKRRNTHQQQQQHPNNKFINENDSISSSSNNNKINDFHYKSILIHHKNRPQQQLQQHPTTKITTQALTFDDIITPHNSRTTSPKNTLISTVRQQSINETNEPTYGYNFHYKSKNKRQKRSDNSTTTTIYADVAINRPSLLSSSASTLHHKQSQKDKPHQQKFLEFKSTAYNEDSVNAKNPAITKLLKRSTTKRKEFEFRKRRRIRPCLSVCQTVEQKCPYLLPADRAPSMPTQYAGEPTFLCLDYNVAETEEQLRKASHGLSDCCYTYCSNSADGICTYCDDMWDKTEIDKEAEILNEEKETQVFNITMKTTGHAESAATIRVETKIQQKLGEEKNTLKMSTVAIVVRNDTAFENATRLAERLRYYAFCDGVFYYDDNVDDMPEYPNSENCRRLPPVQNRCSIPYYATNYISSADMLGIYRKHNETQKLLIWLSTLLCLWSCYNARSMRMRRYNEDKRQQQTEQPQQNNLINNIAFMGGKNMCHKCQTREIMQNERKCNEKIIELWYDYRESRVLIIYLLKTKNETKKLIDDKNTLSEKFLIVSHFRQILHTSSFKKNLKTFKIQLMIFLNDYAKALFLLCFKKRQKPRKRRIQNFPATTTGVMALNEKSWCILIPSSFTNLKWTPKKSSFYKNKIYYYYCSCSKIFSCSCNNNIKNNYYYNNNNYLKKFKYNFNTCNFNEINTKYNKNKNNNNNNKMMKIKIIYKQISIIKFNTNTRTTHIFIMNSYNNKKIYCYNIITIVIISCNINNSSDKKKNKQIFNSFSLKPNTSHHHYYYNYYNNYIYYYKPKFKSNQLINLLKISTFTLPITLTLTLTSTLTITFTLYNLLKTNTISKIMLMIIIVKLNMLIRFIMPLLFKSFMRMRYNNNHHMKNIYKFEPSFSPSTSCNSKKINYRYFYYYNFDINDWWQRRRWWRRKRRPVENPKLYYSRESLLLNGLIRQEKVFQQILL